MAEAVLTHPPSLLPACLCDTSPEQLVRTFTLANNLLWYTFAPPPLAQHPNALDTMRYLSATAKLWDAA